MPPICVVDLCLSQGIWQYSWGAFLLYLTNLLGITLACMLVFIAMGYGRISHVLGWTLGLTSILLLPLGASFFQLVKQSQLQATLRRNLVNRTITIGRQVELVKTKVNWTKNPLEVYLDVQTDKPITPKQVRLVQEFLQKEMNQRFTIIVRTTQVHEVRASDSLEKKTLAQK